MDSSARSAAFGTGFKLTEEFCRSIAGNMNESSFQLIFGGGNTAVECRDTSDSVSDLLLNLTKDGPLRTFIESQQPNDAAPQSKIFDEDCTEKFLGAERHTRAAHNAFKDRVPSDIWHCCRKMCFTSF